MTTAAKRARKKANKLKGWPTPEEAAREVVSDLLDSPTATEAEHAAALTALSSISKLKKKLKKEEDA